MAALRIYKHRVPEGADWQPMDLFAYGTGLLPVHSQITSIDISIFKVLERTPIHEFLGLSPGNGVTGPFFNTPVLDGGWKLGPPGYNFKRRIEMSVLEAASVVIEAGQRYRCEITLNGTSEGRLISIHEYHVGEVYGHP